MLTPFHLLFRKSYWQTLFRGASWREAWLSLRRAHKDRRARKHVLGFALLLVIPIICLAYLAWLAGSGALFFVPFVIPIMWWRSRREKQDSIPLHIVAVSPDLSKELSAQQKTKIRSYFVELALFYAAMLARAGSDVFLQEKTLPSGLEVTSRRTYIDLLRSRGLWEKISGSDRRALMMADGHWEDYIIAQANQAMEPLRLLRWILGLDPFLPDIGQQLQGSYKLATDFLERYEQTIDGSLLADNSSIRIERDAAQGFYVRCLAEAISRRLYNIEDEPTLQWAKDFSSQLAGKQHEDLVLGEKLVGEASDLDILSTISLAKKRSDFLTQAMSTLEEAKIPVELPPLCHLGRSRLKTRESQTFPD